MLKSIYSRIFYLCTIFLMFACALTGLIITLNANRMHETEARNGFARTSRFLLSRVREMYADSDSLPVNTVQSELETFSVIEYVDCYIFSAEGELLVRSDYASTPVSLSPAEKL